MRRLIIAAAALALTLTLAPAALAAGGVCDGTGPGGGAGGGADGGAQAQVHARNVTYSLNATVKVVDTGASTISALVRQSNRHARAYRGDVVTIAVTAQTRLYRRTADGRLVVVTLDAFQAGDRITSVGALDESAPQDPVFTASRVTLRPAAGTGPNCAS